MAKAKKTAAITLEERLEQALVPEREQPYQVPENWCWTKLGSVCRFENGYAFKSDKFSKEEGIPVIRISDIKDSVVLPNDSVLTAEKKIDDRYIVKNGDLLIAMSGATTGKNGIYVSNKIAFLNQRIGNIKIIDSTKLLFQYRNYFIMNMQQEILSSAYGGAQPNISSNIICSMSLPLPPLAEQQRIVDRIESLFVKLDEAKEKAQVALDSFETRKAAILHKAFTGELTAKWREENGVGMDIWETTTVKAICHDIKVGIVIKPSQYYTAELDGTPAFRSANVREFHIDNFDWVYLSSKGQGENQRSIVHTGDVLIVRSGNPGTACVVTEEFNGFNAIDILIAVPNRKFVTSDFLCAFTNSPIGRKLVAENKRGMALAHFNVGGYSQLPISLPTIKEQTEIVRLLDGFFAKEQKAKELCSVTDNIDLIKKSILAHALRGELSTNNPTEESAVELLKSIV